MARKGDWDLDQGQSSISVLLLCVVAFIVISVARVEDRRERIAMAAPTEADECRNQAVELLLHETRKKLVDSNPNEALCTLLEAIRITQGEESIIGILDEAKKRVAEESLYSENDMLVAAQRMSIYLQSDESSVLFANGRTDILRDAFEDGSSVVCPDCSSLIPRARAEIHRKYWCSANCTVTSDSD